MIDNYYIADQFSLLAKLMDIHGENSFKSKSYAIAAFNIEKLPVQLASLEPAEMYSLKGIGESTGKKVSEIIKTGKLEQLEKIIAATPAGVIDMLNIKGIGPKKINTIWKEMQLESLGELLYACEENRLLLYKGFGAKTQQNVKEAIEFYLSNRESFLYAEVEQYALEIDALVRSGFPGRQISFTGEFRRQSEIINTLEWITTIPEADLTTLLVKHDMTPEEKTPPRYTYRGQHIKLSFLVTEEADYCRQLFETSCSSEFLLAWKSAYGINNGNSEAEIFSAQHVSFIPSFMREDPAVIERAKTRDLTNLITTADIKGIIHSHSNWSDGNNTLEEMAAACIANGYEYLVISDHSKSAFYANGLSEERIEAQHRHIEELNKKLAPFRIFKSIECDILNDGSMDYSNDILATFDLVIASVHSNLKMPEEKATTRLLKAIENPYTRILGHMTGRLLLSRKGYPIDHTKIIDACLANNVVIELNAHPRRLDMDWRFIPQALDKGVMISIDPDAHSVDGYRDVRYGVLAAQKGGLTAAMNVSSKSREQFEQFIAS